MHTPRKDNCRGVMSSRWQNIGTEADCEVSGSLALRKVAVYACEDADYTLPSKRAVKSSQLEALAAMKSVSEIHTPFGVGHQESGGLFRVSLEARQVIGFRTRSSVYRRD